VHDDEGADEQEDDDDEFRGLLRAGAEAALDTLRELAAGWRDPSGMRARAFIELARLVAQNERYDAHVHHRDDPAEDELERAQEAAARSLRTWFGALPLPMWQALGSASPLEPWTGGFPPVPGAPRSCFALMYDGSLLAIAQQLGAIPASEAEAERTIKIIRAVIGKHSSQMSNATLIARVRLAMQCLQRRRDARRAAREARAVDRARHGRHDGVDAPECTANVVGDGGEFAPVPRQGLPQAMPGTDMFLEGVDAHIAQNRWPDREPLPAPARGGSGAARGRGRIPSRQPSRKVASHGGSNE
jgi:hypothetical protein